jgi:hypothetical protein
MPAQTALVKSRVVAEPQPSAWSRAVATLVLCKPKCRVSYTETVWRGLPVPTQYGHLSTKGNSLISRVIIDLVTIVGLTQPVPDFFA